MPLYLFDKHALDHLEDDFQVRLCSASPLIVKPYIFVFVCVCVVSDTRALSLPWRL